MGLGIHESLITVDDEGCVLVPVQNYDGVSVHLEEGMEVGTVSCVEKVIDIGNVSELL